ncbi:nitrogen regulation protein NR(I) [Gilliamella sp. wkB178]|uniref:nitrogen regulation protein NR(I) n=1 Tax=Gilliamella sp. wkB178 TaxID=3120259 RepID=UPI00080E4CCA|nr:nitrogen regulation protein NR(I) [Gilliamella apicola]OCG06578.1 nitrogen regulation protein NR(I) [Gilliamella apicola]
MKVWVVDDDSSIRWVLEKALTNANFECDSFASGQEVIDALATQLQKPAVLISDIKMPGIDGLSLLNYVKEQLPSLPVIIMTAHSDLDAAVNAYQKGAYDYIPKPFDVDEVIQLVERAILQSQNQKTNSITTTKASTGIIGEAPAMQEVFRIIGRLSKSSISVLINGESGTGKELVAKALHTHSPRANAPFIALNMAAIPKDLIESELFGHEKGAFTGAAQIRHGRFEQANGGTLFLDEIGDMPLDVQTRLLRVLADGQFYRIGGYSPVKVDVRIIAATHQDLELRVREGKFREDLFHRLNVIRILLPPLRDRAQDIPKLAEHFLHTTAKELGVESKVFSPEALSILCMFNWPGNVRQLENTCRWVTVMSSNKEILVQDLPPELLKISNPKDSLNNEVNLLSADQAQQEVNWQILLEQWAKQALVSGKTEILTAAVNDVERILLNCALNFTRGHKQDAAHLLGWGRNTLTRKLKELSIDNKNTL